MTTKTRRFVSALASAVLIGAALTVVSGGGAQAAPVCNVPDAPPACHPKPPAPPAPPAVLESPAFTPIAGEMNVIYVIMDPVAHSAVAGYNKGDETPYRVAISCSNGFFYSKTLNKATGDTVARHDIVPADAAAGTCYATTWDQSTLKLTHSKVVRKGVDATSFELWDITFTP